MEPIILLPTSSQDLTTIKAPANPAPSEGDFDSVLTALQSSNSEEKDSDQNLKLADPSILSNLSIFLSMLQPSLGQNPGVSPEILGGQPENSAATTPILSNPINPLIQEYYPNLSQVNEKDLLFPGEIVNQDQKTLAPTVIPKEQGKATSVVPGVSVMPESPLETSPSIQNSLPPSPSPGSSSDQAKNILTAGTQLQELSNTTTPSLANTANIQLEKNQPGSGNPSNISLEKNVASLTINGESLRPIQNSLPPSPSPSSSSDQAKNILTAGTQLQELSKTTTPSLANTANIQLEKNQPGSGNPSNISLEKNVASLTINGESLRPQETARDLTKDNLFDSRVSALSKGVADPAGKEKSEEILRMVSQGDKRSIDFKVKNGNGFAETAKQQSENPTILAKGNNTVQDLITGRISPKNLQERSPLEKALANLSIGEKEPNPLLEELKGSEKILIEKDGSFSFSKNGVENGVESSLILKPEGNQQTTSSPNQVTSAREPALPRTEAPEILQQISKKLIWSIRNGEEKIKLQLEPPQLGSLYIEINRQKDTLQATLWTNNQVTKELLESHQVELQKILKQDGFHLGQFDVFVNQNMRSFQERREGQVGDDRLPYASRETHGSSSRDGAETLPLGAFPGMKGSQYIDLFI